MGNFINKESWLGLAQLRYVEQLAWWHGVVSRREVVEKFGCSGQQASAIIQGYLELNPDALKYCLKVRRYLASPKMRCYFEEPDFTQELEKEPDWVGVIDLPIKRVDTRVLRCLMVAVQQGRSVRMGYQSRSMGKAEKREIVPHAFGFDGLRYHVRAWCLRRGEFRDFSLLRVQSVAWPDQKFEGDLPVDEDWETEVEVRLRINGNVSEGLRQALMEDYELSSPREPVVIRCRRAMRRYVLYRMGFDAESELPSVSFFELSD